MADVFVSYSRRDKPFVEKLVAGLAQDGRDIWVDWQDIPRAADWLNEIDKGIENATSFIFVVSSHSLSSEICNHELEYALKFNKRIVPIIREDIAGENEAGIKSTWAEKTWGKMAIANWSAVSHLNWIFFNNDDEEHFKTEFKALLETLDADLEHIKAHTRLLIREREWEENAQKPGYLLSGEEIAEAETWLAEADKLSKDPEPTDMHRDYIAKSRAAENERLENLRRLESRTRQFRLAAGVLGIAIVAAIIAAVVAVQESTKATNRAATAIVQVDVAETAIEDANIQLVDAEQRVEDANATLTPIPPTLTQSANDIAEAQQQVQDANATLTPIPPTLTQAANDIADANEQLAEAEQQVIDANATLAPIPPTLTQSADDIASANQLVATAEAELTSIPPTLDALDLQISEAEERVEALNLAAQALELGTAAGERLNEGNADLAALLAIESLNISYNPGADNALVSASNRLFTEELIPFPDTELWEGAISSNGSLILLALQDGIVNFYDASTGELRPAQRVHRENINASIFVPDSPLAITGDWDGNIVFWNAQTGASIGQLNADMGSVLAFDVTDDGRRLAVGLSLGDFCIIDIRDIEIDYCIYTEDEEVRDLAFSPDGDYLAATFGLGADLWELDSDDAYFLDYFGDHRFITTAIDYSPDGRYILTASEDESMILWEIDNGGNENEWGLDSSHEVMRYEGDTNVINQAFFTPDGNYIISGSIDGTPRMWDVFSGRVVRSFGGHTNNIGNLTMTADGRRLLSISYDDSARIWNSDIRISRGVYRGHEDWVTNLAFSPDGLYLASASNDFTIRIWDIAEHRLFDMLELDGYLPEGLAYLPDGSGILFDYDDTLYLWDFAEDDIEEYADLPGYPETIRITGDNQYAVMRMISDDSDYAGYLNLETGVYETVSADLIQSIAIAENRNVMAWISDFETVTLYDIDAGSEIASFDLLDFGELESLAISDDTSTAMIGRSDGLVVFVDTATGTISSEHREHTTNVSSIDISPDGLIAASSGLDDRVIVWDMTTRSVLRVYNNHTNWVYEAIFSPDGSLIASAGVDRTVQVWYSGLDELIADVCANLSRDLLEVERERFRITNENPTCPAVN